MAYYPDERKDRRRPRHTVTLTEPTTVTAAEIRTGDFIVEIPPNGTHRGCTIGRFADATVTRKRVVAWFTGTLPITETDPDGPLVSVFGAIVRTNRPVVVRRVVADVVVP